MKFHTPPPPPPPTQMYKGQGGQYRNVWKFHCLLIAKIMKFHTPHGNCTRGGGGVRIRQVPIFLGDDGRYFWPFVSGENLPRYGVFFRWLHKIKGKKGGGYDLCVYSSTSLIRPCRDRRSSG